MKKLFFVLLFAASAIISTAQKVEWHNPQEADIEAICGRWWCDALSGTYARLPQTIKDSLRQSHWDLSRNSAGLSVSFTTDAQDISVRYVVEGAHSMYHMPSTGVSGIDLYKDDLKTGWCRAEWPSFGDTICFNYKKLNPKIGGSTYTLYLPLYTTTKSLEVAVPQGATFAWNKVPQEKPLVVYGTSITQGACASRPAMAWATIVSRTAGIPVVNLGFSGQGQLDMPMFRMLGEIPARAYIIDCMPNMTDNSSPEIYGRLTAGIRYLRSKTDAPIVIAEHNGYTNDISQPSAGESWRTANAEQRRAYNALRKEGIANLHYVTTEQLKMTRDNQVDGVHPSDLGMQQYADAYIKALKKAKAL